MTTLYIHGFASSGEGSKAKLFREYYRSIGERFIAPSLSYIPALALKTLEELIESYDRDVKLIGSSLGGYYATFLAQKYKLKAVLINPAINPETTLKRALGEMTNFYDGSYAEWRESHLDMLKTYATTVTTQENFMVLLQKGDDLLDYKEAEEKLPQARVVIEEGGSHSFDGIQRYFQEIQAF